jgi:hypothetical protein
MKEGQFYVQNAMVAALNLIHICTWLKKEKLSVK